MSIQDPRGIGFGVCRLGGGSNFPSGKFKLLEFAVKFAKIGVGPPVKQNYPSDPSHLPKFFFLYPLLLVTLKEQAKQPFYAPAFLVIYKYVIIFLAHGTLYS